MAYSWYGYNTAQSIGFVTDTYGNASQEAMMDRMFKYNGRTPLYRVAFNMQVWEDSGRNPGVYDTFMAKIRDRGLGVQVILTNKVGPNHVPTPPSGTQMDTWYQFCKAMARRYGERGTFWGSYVGDAKVRFWEIWNEPNYTKQWGNLPVSCTAYNNLLMNSTQAIYEAEGIVPRVLFGGLRGTYEQEGGAGTDSMEAHEFLYICQYLNPNILYYYSYVGLHFYPDPNLYSFLADEEPSQVRQVRRQIEKLRSTLNGMNLTAKKIWLNEFSVDHSTYQNQEGFAFWMLQTLESHAASDKWNLGPWSWYVLGELHPQTEYNPAPPTDLVDPRTRFNGLIEWDLVPAYRAWYQWDAGAQRTTLPAFTG